MAKNLDFLMDKLYDMNKFLGGDLYKTDYRSKNGNLLKILNNDFCKKYREVKEFQDLRNAERKQGEVNIKILKWNNEVKVGFAFMKNVIEKMNSEFKKIEKKMDEETRLNGKALIINCQRMFDNLKQVEVVNNNFKKNIQIKGKLKADYKKDIVNFDVEDPDLSEEDEVPVRRKRNKGENGKPTKVNNNVLKQLKKVPLTEAEKNALEKWKKKDGEMDTILDSIGNKLDEMLTGLEDFEDHLERNEKLINYIGNEAFKLNEQAETTNAQMKIILDKFKRPGRMCIDICMGFILAALIGLFTYLFRRYLAAGG